MHGAYRDVMYIDPAYAETLAHVGLNTVENVLNCAGDRLSAWSRTTDTVQVHLSGGASLFIKRYHYPRWRNRIKGMFRGTFFGLSRVRSEYRALATMRGLGIHAVRPVAYGERRRWHFLRSSFLITEAVPGAVSLATYAQQYGNGNPSARTFRQRQEALTVLARQVRHMHDQGVVHGDLFLRNIMIRVLGQQGCEFYFIDAGLGRRMWGKARRRRHIIDDLAGLMAVAPTFCSRTDLVRFAKTYLSLDRLDRSAAAWMASVADRSRAYRRHEALRLRYNDVFNRYLRNLERLERAPGPSGEAGHSRWVGR